MDADTRSTDHESNERSQVGVSLCFANDSIPSDSIREISFNERLEDGRIVKSAAATVSVSGEARWDYHSEAVLKGPHDLFHRGLCVRATRTDDGSIELSFEDAIWELERASVKNIEFFGMPTMEIAYWFPQLTGLVRGVKVDGLTLNQEHRPFLYAVPLSGLTATGDIKSFFAGDFGVVAGDDDLFAPLLSGADIGKKQAVWQPENPKAWGMVFARNPIEAEKLALTRAQFTADLVSFALRTGISHLIHDTRQMNSSGMSTLVGPWYGCTLGCSCGSSTKSKGGSGRFHLSTRMRPLILRRDSTRSSTLLITSLRLLRQADSWSRLVN